MAAAKNNQRIMPNTHRNAKRNIPSVPNNEKRQFLDHPRSTTITLKKPAPHPPESAPRFFELSLPRIEIFAHGTDISARALQKAFEKELEATGGSDEYWSVEKEHIPTGHANGVKIYRFAMSITAFDSLHTE